MWKMIHEANAIEAMAISVRFSEPVGAVLSRRLLADLKTSASAAGLIDEVPMTGFQVNIANPGDVRPIAGSAMLYQKTSIVRNRTGAVEKQLTSQIEFQPTHLTFHTWRYSSWSEELANAIKIFTSPLARAIQGSAIGAIRLEYLDRFWFDGDAADAEIKDLLRTESGWIAPHIFTGPSLWHSHSGRFDSEAPGYKRLSLVNVDYQDLTGPTPSFVGKRSVQLVSAAEDQFADLGKEMPGEEIEEFLSSTLNDLHTSALSLFKEIVNESFARSNGLPT